MSEDIVVKRLLGGSAGSVNIYGSYKGSSRVDTAGHLQNANGGRDFCSCFTVFQN